MHISIVITQRNFVKMLQTFLHFLPLFAFVAFPSCNILLGLFQRHLVSALNLRYFQVFSITFFPFHGWNYLLSLFACRCYLNLYPSQAHRAFLPNRDVNRPISHFAAVSVAFVLSNVHFFGWKCKVHLYDIVIGETSIHRVIEDALFSIISVYVCNIQIMLCVLLYSR